MADITKCLGRNCRLKDSCYRFIVSSYYRQSYCDFDKTYEEELKKDKQYICEYYWKI